MANGRTPIEVASAPLNEQIATTLQRPVRSQQAPIPPRLPRVPPIPLMPSHPPVQPTAPPTSQAPTAASGALIAVRIPNVGTVRFPASMSLDEIALESERLATGAGVEAPSLAARAIPMGMRIAPMIAGGIIGSAGGPFAPITVPLAAAIGSGLGEYAGETYEVQTGQREDINPYQVVMQTALGAIPAGRTVGATARQIAAYRAGQGALMGGGATAATQYAETGELPTARQLATGTVMGGLMGGTLGRVEGRVRAAPPAPVMRPDIGAIVEHPQLGRLHVVGFTDDGMVQVSRGGNRRWTVAPELLTPAAELPGLPQGVAPMWTDIPATQAPDVSGGRGVPAAVIGFDASGRPIYSGDPSAQSVSRPVRGALPPGRTAIVPEPPPGAVPTDRSGGRSAPAASYFDESGQRIYVSDPGAVSVPRSVRGALPAGPRFFAQEGGTIIPAEQADMLRPQPSPVTPPPVGVSGGRTIPTAPVAYNIDPDVPAKRGITVGQYSGDPNAVVAPVVGDTERQWLEAMRADLEALPPQRGRLIRDPNDPNFGIYAHGGRGSYVGEDVRVISGQRVGNREIQQAVEDLLEGRPPTTRLHTAILDAARGYAEKRPGYQGPSIKPGSQWVTPRGAARSATAAPFTARRAASLGPDEARVQERAAQDLEQNLNAYIDAYQRDFGRVLNADNASELFADYAASPATRSAYARAVRGPAASLVDEMYTRALAEPVPDGLERVVFLTSGGNGSGKSTVIGAGNKAAVALDSTLSDFAASKAKIDQALAAGFDVNIFHVARDPVEAFRSVLSRASGESQSGRPVPVTIHARTHVQSPRVLAQLATTYANNPRVRIQAFSNEGGAELRPLRLDEVSGKGYDDVDGLLAQLRAVLDEEYAAGRVTPDLYRSIAGQDPPSAGFRGERDFQGSRGSVRDDDTPTGREAGPPVGSAAPPAAIDDFDRFTRLFDDVEAPRGREPGEEGFISPMLAARLGGAAGGAAVGAATGDTPQERAENAVLFGLAGAAAPSMLPRGVKTPRAVAQQLRREGLQPNTPAWTRRWAQVQGPPARSGQPIEDPMKGVDVFLDKFKNPLVRDGVRQRLTENAGYAEQRRGVIDSKTLGRFANEVRVNAEKILPKGTALNAEQVTAYARALQVTQRRVNELAATVASAAATDADVLALHAAKADAEVVTKSLMGARAEAGRALGAFNLYQSVLDTGNVQLIRDTLRAPGLRGEAERIARELAKLPDDPLVRYNWLRAQKSSTLMDKARSVYYANILSGVKTHERNILGNVANLTTALVTQPVAAGVDVVRSAVRGTPRTVTFSELPSNVAGAVAGLERGFRDLFFTLRHGVSPDRLTRTVGGAVEGSKFDLPRVEFIGGAGNPFNWPGRTLDAGDALFRSIARNMELYGLAHTQAKNEGLTGQRFLNRVAELRSGLSQEGQAIRQQAEAFATRAVFQEKPGPIVGGYQNLVRHAPALTLVTPFVKTPGAIFRQGIEFSPAGALMKAVRQGGRAGAQAQARVALGTVATGYLFWLAASDRLSSGGPRDSVERNALMESGWRPNSLRIGDRWVSYQLMQPVSVQMAAVSSAVEAWREAGSDPKAAPDVIAKTIAKFGGSFLDQSFWSGLFDVVEALNNPERAAERWAGRLVSSAIPFTGAVRSIQQAMDPVVRQPQGIKETMMSGVPQLSERVPARIGRFGQEIKREGGPIRRMADPFNVSSKQDDEVAREIDRLGVRLGVPVGRLTIEGENLSRVQSQELKILQGNAIRAALERLVTGRGYAKLSDEQRKEWVDRTIRRTRADVNERYRRSVARERRQAPVAAAAAQ